MSRKDRPKQLLPLIGERSLLELSAMRVRRLVPPNNQLICAAEKYRDAIMRMLPQITPRQYLGEPMGRDTVNAVGLTAAVLLKRDPKAAFAVMTADHLIEPQNEFEQKLDMGFKLVESDPSRFVTFSIRPAYAATGYGYVERSEPIAGFPGAFKAGRFAEKPDLATAQAYLASGTFNWNSGMFIFSAAKFMEALSWFMPDNHRGLMKIAHAWDTPDQAKVLHEIYPTLKRVSVDFGVMEPAARDPRITLCTVPMNVSWMDVGSWTSYGETLQPDAQGNRSNTRTAHLDARNVLAISDDPDHTIAALDCKDLIIIHTADATLVCPRESAERIKDLAAKVDPKLQ
jgi:mannose-1-phosphate guanylyltransferase